MARNEEKQHGLLNRLLLHKQKEEFERLHPKRPKLDSLQTEQEIKHWIPSIKRDIDFYLKKSQVVCYSDEHVAEARLMVCKLEKEFKAFLRKLNQLSPGVSEIPWNMRVYKSKNEGVLTKPYDGSAKFVPIATPLLDLEQHKPVDPNPVIEYPPTNDLPLTFNFPVVQNKEESNFKSVKRKMECASNCMCSSCASLKRHSINEVRDASVPCSSGIKDVLSANTSEAIICDSRRSTVDKIAGKNVLGLDYGSSSSEDES